MGIGSFIKRGVKAAATGGLSEVPGVNGAINQTLSGAGLGPAPNAWDAAAATKPVMANAQGVYDQSMAGVANVARSGPSIDDIYAQQISGPSAVQAQQIAAPGAIQATDVGVSDLVAGQQAADLRAQQLSQAETAANSPSSAAAQMRAAGAQIQGQQSAMAAAARGPGRAAARRDAMLATGNLGMQAANQTAALAAQENAAKQQAFSQALAGVRAGDVTGANVQANVGVANQQAGLQAQTTTNAQALAAAQANQGAGLAAAQTTAANQLAASQSNQAANLQGQIAQQGNDINAWNAQQNAIQGYLGLGNQAVGQQNSANATWAGYGSKQNELQQKQNAALTSTVTQIGGSLLSDVRSKEDVATFGQSAPSPWGPGDDTKQAVEQMNDDDLIDWAHMPDLATYRYKPGMADGGASPQVGVSSAQRLEQTGPLGELMVSEGPDGFKRVDYPKLAYATGKAALAKADKIEDLYHRLAQDVQVANQRSNRSRKGA